MYPVYKPGDTTGLRRVNQKSGDIINEEGNEHQTVFAVETQEGIYVEVQFPRPSEKLSEKVLEFVRSLEKDLI